MSPSSPLLGTLVSALLSVSHHPALNPLLSQFKQAVQTYYPSQSGLQAALTQLGLRPDSEVWQRAFQEEAERSGAVQDQRLLEIAQQLAEAVKKAAPVGPLTATAGGSSAVGQGNTVIGARAVQVGGDVGGDIITGDKIQHILNLYHNAPGQPHLNEAAFKQALGRYLGWVERNYGRLNLRGLQQQERQNPSLTLADVYVSLQAQVAVDPRRQGRRVSLENSPESLNMSQLLEQGQRLVIIGAPGSGKTTYLRLIATALARALRTGDTAAVQANLGLTGNLPLPILIALSEFNAYRRQYSQPDDPHHGTLTTFLSYTLIRQHNIDLPADFFERLLRQGQGCALLLDGLDEIADERERWLVRQAVEELSDNAGIPHIIVTSRTRAYQGRTILPPTFRLAEVQPMTQDQVNALVHRWCYAVYDPAVAAEETTDLQQAIATLEALRQRREDRQLVDTPLLTTIVAIVHYDQRRLPQQRAALYEKCIEVLLAERHKPDRPVFYDLADWGGTLAEKRDWLAHLAYQMMSAGEKAGRTVSQDQLLTWLQPTLTSRFGTEEATRRLDAFVQALRERGSLLHERGGDYQFSHLTFQEYLTAYYLAETIRQVDKMVALLLDNGRLGQSWWRETVLLVAGHLENKSAAAALDFIKGLITYTRDDALGLAAAELAAAAYLELDSQDSSVQAAVRSVLTRRLTDPQLVAPASLRVLAGRTLSRLGDTRPGVGFVVKDGLKMPDIVWGEIVPAGIYVIGGDRIAYGGSNKREVSISQLYRLACYPVTYVQFDCFVKACDFEDIRWWKGMPASASNLGEQRFRFTNHPREQVSWYQAVAFCRWLSDKLSYKVDLPHEYEWEIAARYPHNGYYPWGNELDVDKANTSEAGIESTTAVGIYPQGLNTACRLSDLSGNVWEWCCNKYDHPEEITVDDRGATRVLRGGSWDSRQHFGRAAYRNNNHPNRHANNIGFRLVCRFPSHDLNTESDGKTTLKS